MALHPQAQAVADELDRMGTEDVEDLEPREARQQPTLADAARRLRARRGMDPDGEPVAAVEEHHVTGPACELPVRLYRPHGCEQPAPLLVWLHGGGWVIGETGSSEATCRALARRSGCLVASVGYRRAPESLLPAAYEDAFAATRGLVERASALGADPDRVALGGESAGATLALATARGARTAGVVRPRVLLLLCPVTDLSGRSPSSPGEDGALGGRTLEWMLEHVVEEREQAADPRMSPLRATDDQLAGLPPTLLLSARLDALHDQDEAFARRLESLGVAVEHRCLEEVLHGFGEMVGLVEPVDEAFDRAAEVLRGAMDGAPGAALRPRAEEEAPGAPG